WASPVWISECFFFSSRRRHTRSDRDWSSDVCSSDLGANRPVGSWGYQPTGLFAPTSRFGSPADFAALVAACHQAGLAVWLDWVRSEERRVGKEWRPRGWREGWKKNNVATKRRVCDVV